MTCEEVVRAVRSFSGPRGSAGGPDDLRPQHLKEMVYNSAGGMPAHLLRFLTAFTNLAFEGKSTSSLCPFFFKASLIALEKKGVGMRPIAVRCTLRCLVAEHARN